MWISSSVCLVQVAGTSGKIQTSGDADNDEGISTEMHGLAIIEALGMQRRNEVRQPLCWCSAAPPSCCGAGLRTPCHTASLHHLCRSSSSNQ